MKSEQKKSICEQGVSKARCVDSGVGIGPDQADVKRTRQGATTEWNGANDLIGAEQASTVHPPLVPRLTKGTSSCRYPLATARTTSPTKTSSAPDSWRRRIISTSISGFRASSHRDHCYRRFLPPASRLSVSLVLRQLHYRMLTLSCSLLSGGNGPALFARDG